MASAWDLWQRDQGHAPAVQPSSAPALAYDDDDVFDQLAREHSDDSAAAPGTAPAAGAPPSDGHPASTFAAPSELWDLRVQHAVGHDFGAASGAPAGYHGSPDSETAAVTATAPLAHMPHAPAAYVDERSSSFFDFKAPATSDACADGNAGCDVGGVVHFASQHSDQSAPSTDPVPTVDPFDMRGGSETLAHEPLAMHAAHDGLSSRPPSDSDSRPAGPPLECVLEHVQAGHDVAAGAIFTDVATDSRQGSADSALAGPDAECGPPRPTGNTASAGRTFVSLSGPPSGCAALLTEASPAVGTTLAAAPGLQRSSSIARRPSAGGEWLQVHTVAGEPPVATGGGVDALKAALRSARRAVDGNGAAPAAPPARSTARGSPPEVAAPRQPADAPASAPEEAKPSRRRRGGLFGLLGRRNDHNAGAAQAEPDLVPDDPVTTEVLDAARAAAAGGASSDAMPRVAAELVRLDAVRCQHVLALEAAACEADATRQAADAVQAELATLRGAHAAVRGERDSAQEHVADIHACLIRAMQDVVLLRWAAARMPGAAAPSKPLPPPPPLSVDAGAAATSAPEHASVARCAKCEGALESERARATALDQRLQELLRNSQQSEENAERVRSLAEQLESLNKELAAARGGAAAAEGRADALRRELHALAEASQRHLGEYAALSDTLNAVSQERDQLRADTRAREEPGPERGGSAAEAAADAESTARLEAALQDAFESRDRAEAALAVALRQQAELQAQCAAATARAPEAGTPASRPATPLAEVAAGPQMHTGGGEALQQQLQARATAEAMARQALQRLLAECYGVTIDADWLQTQGVDTSCLMADDAGEGVAEADGGGADSGLGAGGSMEGRDEAADGSSGGAGGSETKRGGMLRFLGL